MRQRFSREQWVQWLDEFQQTGLSVPDFCARKRISSKSFYRWRRKLRREVDQPDSEQDPQFVSVAFSGSPLVEIAMPCGATIRVPNDPSSLRPVLQTLLEVGAQP